MWSLTAAHVSLPKQPGEPRPPVDPAVWRVVGTPLVPPTGSGALDGVTLAVKDLFAVAGQPIGAGNPDLDLLQMVGAIEGNTA